MYVLFQHIYYMNYIKFKEKMVPWVVGGWVCNSQWQGEMTTIPSTPSWLSFLILQLECTSPHNTLVGFKISASRMVSALKPDMRGMTAGWHPQKESFCCIPTWGSRVNAPYRNILTLASWPINPLYLVCCPDLEMSSHLLQEKQSPRPISWAHLEMAVYWNS